MRDIKGYHVCRVWRGKVNGLALDGVCVVLSKEGERDIEDAAPISNGGFLRSMLVALLRTTGESSDRLGFWTIRHFSYSLGTDPSKCCDTFVPVADKPLGELLAMASLTLEVPGGEGATKLVTRTWSGTTTDVMIVAAELMFSIILPFEVE